MISNISANQASLNTNLQSLQNTAESAKTKSGETTLSSEQAKQLAQSISLADPSALINAININKLESSQTFSLMA